MPIVRWPLWFVLPCYAMVGFVRVMSVYKGYPDMRGSTRVYPVESFAQNKKVRSAYVHNEIHIIYIMC